MGGHRNVTFNHLVSDLTLRTASPFLRPAAGPLPAAAPARPAPAPVATPTLPTDSVAFPTLSPVPAPPLPAPEPEALPAAPAALPAPRAELPSTLLQELPAAPAAEETPSPMQVMLRQLNEARQGRTELVREMRGRENAYIENYPMATPQLKADFRARYGDSRVSAERVGQFADKFAADRGVALDHLPPGAAALPLGSNTAPMLRESLDKIVDGLFNSDKAARNPEKAESVKHETRRFLELVSQCQAEGSVGPMTLGEVQALAARNVTHLAVQDLVASETPVGDHGVRHLVDHNIGWCENFCDQLQGHGVPVSAKDRLVMHQAMIVHDLGYATQNVRGRINATGDFDLCHGHNALAGRYLRERFANADDPFNKLFNAEDVSVMHRSVLYHDVDQQRAPGIHFDMAGGTDVDARTRRLESITRLADNSHAFVDKLPELVLSHPRALPAVRLLRTAQELGDMKLSGNIRQNLIDEIGARPDLSAQDRGALQLAAKNVQALELEFITNRTAGTDPDITIGPGGEVHVDIAESPLHQKMASVLGQPTYKLLGSMLKDIGGTKEAIGPDTPHVQQGKVTFDFALGSSGAKEFTPAESRIYQAYLADPVFTGWAVQDVALKNTQSTLEALLGATHSPSFREAAAAFVDVAPGENPLPALQARLTEVRDQRRALLHQQLER